VTRQEKALRLLNFPAIEVYRSLSVDLFETLNVEEKLLDHDFRAESQDHGTQLDVLAAIACAEASPQDVLIILDSDSVLFSSTLGKILELLTEYEFVVVERHENGGDDFPHPLLFAGRVDSYIRCDFRWSDKPNWENSNGTIVSDVGTSVGLRMKELGIEFCALTKTNMNEVPGNPPLISVYSNLVYHHGAGSREPRTRGMGTALSHWGTVDGLGWLPETVKKPLKRLRGLMISVRRRFVLRQSRVRLAQFEAILDAYLDDGDLSGWERFLVSKTGFD